MVGGFFAAPTGSGFFLACLRVNCTALGVSCKKHFENYTPDTNSKLLLTFTSDVKLRLSERKPISCLAETLELVLAISMVKAPTVGTNSSHFMSS